MPLSRADQKFLWRVTSSIMGINGSYVMSTLPLKKGEHQAEIALMQGPKPLHVDCRRIFVARETKSGDSHQINCEAPCEAHPVDSFAQLPASAHRPSGILGPAAL